VRRFRRHAPRRIAGFGLAVCLAAACSGQSPPEAGVPTHVSAYARVRVVVTRSGDRANVLLTSRFVGFRGVDRTTAELLTGGEPAIAMGCGGAPATAPYEDLVALIPDSAQGKVEHLDAGAVSAVVDGVALATGATARPALAPYISGMEYEDSAASIAVPRGDVIVTGLGGGRVGPFEAAATLPPPVDAHAAWGADLAVTWAPVSADEVVLTIAPERGASAVVCRVADRGEVHVRADLLARIADVRAGDPVTVVIDRARRTGFAAPGLDDASLEVVARDVITASAP
jgi:hypothetical protein